MSFVVRCLSMVPEDLRCTEDDAAKRAERPVRTRLPTAGEGAPGPPSGSVRQQPGRWGREDGREADQALRSHLLDGLGRSSDGRCGRFNAGRRWHQPAQAPLNKPHQHRGTRLDPPAGTCCIRLRGAGWHVFRWGFRRRRPHCLAWDAARHQFRDCGAGGASHAPQRHRPARRWVGALNFPFNQALARSRW